jgi:hypothetical protein
LVEFGIGDKPAAVLQFVAIDRLGQFGDFGTFGGMGVLKLTPFRAIRATCCRSQAAINERGGLLLQSWIH